ncbi:hypothetical protein F5Y10DRAFT_269528 [Nemania abortiva]|nr:hypothetical protein F5Y10DRAFT_269528 [Nemania abortiva]
MASRIFYVLYMPNLNTLSPSRVSRLIFTDNPLTNHTIRPLYFLINTLTDTLSRTSDVPEVRGTEEDTGTDRDTPTADVRTTMADKIPQTSSHYAKIPYGSREGIFSISQTSQTSDPILSSGPIPDGFGPPDMLEGSPEEAANFGVITTSLAKTCERSDVMRRLDRMRISQVLTPGPQGSPHPQTSDPRPHPQPSDPSQGRPQLYPHLPDPQDDPGPH